ncbi:uncharacterized protein METZ01_LOCUS232879, partial [marine metagenome]
MILTIWPALRRPIPVLLGRRSRWRDSLILWTTELIPAMTILICCVEHYQATQAFPNQADSL